MKLAYQTRRQKKAGKCLLALFLLAASCAPVPVAERSFPEGHGTLVAEVSGLRNIRGDLYLSLFSGPQGFPDDTERAVVNRRFPLQQRQAAVTFDDLPYGEYALSLLHDENADGRMDTTLLGIPKEGYGFSNDLEGKFGPPTYEKARFLHVTEETRLAIRVRYVEPKKRGPGF